MQLTIDLGQSRHLIDDLEIIAACYAAVDDLLTGVHIQEIERERIATLLGVLGALHRSAIEQMRQAEEPGRQRAVGNRQPEALFAVN